MDPEHGSIADDPARFRTTRWSAILVAAESRMPGSQDALTELCRLYWHPLYAFARRRGHAPPDAQDLRQEIGRTVSDPADIDQEIHALCEALVATEGRL